ncbi:MAG: SOS response-associated peptidase [Acidimicrobiia bacterium]|nr:SOS response-associated peptidase [Acidimicrobiia bacterium]
MCGRFVASSAPDEVARYFGAEPPSEQLIEANYNVAPTNDVVTVREFDGRRELAVCHWGLVPGWAKDLKVGNRMINARAETVATKNAFRRAFARRRCIVPADGFYEWAAVPGHKKKQPYFISRVDGEPLAFAGLWETWRDPASPDDAVVRIRSTTIVTTSANDTIAPVHDRMPVVLAPAHWDDWLDPANDDTTALGALLVPAPEGLLRLWPVGLDVNQVRNKGPQLIAEIDHIDPDGLGPDG